MNKELNELLAIVKNDKECKNLNRWHIFSIVFLVILAILLIVVMSSVKMTASLHG